MLYDVRLVSRYRYEGGVLFARQVLHQLPVDRPGQRVIAAELTIEPQPTERRDEADFFGNRITAIAIAFPHDRLTLEMRARIAVEPRPPPVPGLTPAWEVIRRAAVAETSLGPRSPAHYLWASRAVPLEPAIADYVAESFTPGRPVLEAGLDLTKRIKRDFTYDPAATDVTTRPIVSFEQRAGVCQDFAHVMISGLRALGLPAIYVSGFLRTEPPPGRPRLEGADATHAWVALWCGREAGWIGLDPTNGVAAGEDHLVLAIGRDYADAAPADGVIVTAGGHSLDVAVDVVPIRK
ncbi:transglutaminase family protein [Prosthecomicrobium pneumaticum]|uniref:Transglutaminase-like putative cysteine protease n=1 Tax=Prosthecomicrobium pneumaticum TaxID=81895 RepID=A0A7W9FP02_9HYPH|nr:transglutaminase family protein [Prosthecomicrobium pneumaticum]MBB5754184.1 transglutaminase-like putative cysteine protease [Prosthecomicrobium pneumaticum]